MSTAHIETPMISFPPCFITTRLGFPASVYGLLRGRLSWGGKSMQYTRERKNGGRGTLTGLQRPGWIGLLMRVRTRRIKPPYLARGRYRNKHGKNT